MRRLTMLLCAMVLAGCGGGDGEKGEPSGGGAAGNGASSGGGDRLSKAEFVAEGKRICQEGAKRTREVVAEEAQKEELQNMSEQERGFHLLEKARPVVEDTMDQIDALEPPQELESDAKKLTDSVREAQELLNGIDSDEDAAEAAPRLKELVTQSRTAARDAGLEACLPENTD